MRPKLHNRLKGYLRLPRTIFYLLETNALSQEEFILFYFYLSVAGWDVNHEDLYGKIETTNKEVARLLGWKSDTTVGRYKKSLQSKGFISVGEYEVIEVINFANWQKECEVGVILHSQPAEIKRDAANRHSYPAEMQVVSTQKLKNPLVSFRGNKIDFKSLTEEDTQWISENLKEDPKLVEQSKINNSHQSNLLQDMTGEELFIFGKELFGEGTKVSCSGEVWK